MKQHGEMIAAISSGLLVLLAWYWEEVNPNWSIVMFIVAYVMGGFVKAKEGLITLWKEKELDVNFLMLFAAIGAASIGYWMEGALLIFIFSLSGALESYTLAKSERDLSSLMEYKPEQARLYQEEGEDQWIPSIDLCVGDWIIVKPGERIPADSQVKRGASAVEQAMITGESIPVDKVVGDEVFAGTLNGSGMLVLEVIRQNEDTLLARIMKRLEEAREEVPVSQHKIAKLEKVYAKVVVLLTLTLIVIPPYLLSWTWSDSLYQAMIFLVVASPCALVASIMPALLSAVSNGARNGLLFKNGIQLEKMAGVKVVAFDKTGTLTIGKLRVTDIIAFHGTKADLVQIAGSIEQGSEHPVARAIVRYAQENKVSFYELDSLQAKLGWGVEAQVNGEKWQIGKPAMFANFSTEIKSSVNRLERSGKTVVVLGNKNEVMGLFALADTIRPEAKEAVMGLKKHGILTVMLTGDQRVTAEAIAQQAGVDLVYSQLLPEEKVYQVGQLKQKYGQVAMIGDGINDAPALSKAQVGIAMGLGGSDVALETADIVLMNDNLTQIPFAIHIGQRMKSVVKQNVIFALAVIGFLIIANFAQTMTLPLGVIGHEGSTLLVILNGLRLLR